MMNPALQQLKDIHLPPALSAWQIAPGWIILMVMGSLLFFFLTYYFYQSLQRKAVVSFALKQLQKLQFENAQADPLQTIAEVSQLIRRTSLHYFPRKKIAGLSGSAWLDFLNQSGKTHQFKTATGELLISGQYQKTQPQDLGPLFAITKQWLIIISKTLPQKETM